MSRRKIPRVHEKSRIFAAIMAFFFGGFGVHKFYLRDPGAGILYIFIFIMTSRFFFPISYILGWIDALRLFTMSDEVFDRKYNKKIVRDEDYYQDSRRGRRSPRPSRRDRREIRRNSASKPKAIPRSVQKANPFKKSGLKKYKEFDLEGAITDFKEGLKIAPDDVSLHFNLACGYSLTEKKEDSFYHLSKAVSLGYDDFDKIKTHDDLAYLRIQPEFEEFKENGFIIKGGGNPELKEGKIIESHEEIKDDVLLSQLNKLAELRKKGLLTEEEFSLERRKLLRR